MIFDTPIRQFPLFALMALACPAAFGGGQAAGADDEVGTVSIPERYRSYDADEVVDDLDDDADAGTGYQLIEDDGGDDYVEPPSQREKDTADLRRLFDLYREALANKDYLEADTLAKRVVELSIRLNGIDSHDSAKALTNLGIAQHNNRDYESALLNFAAAVDIVERIDNRLSPALINPLQGLAATQAATGRPDLARQTYQRAVHVSHVNDGPHNPDQIDTLVSMAELNISTGDLDEAGDIQQSIYSIQSRNIDPDSLEILEALETRANWEHRLQNYHRERITWRRYIDVIEKHYGKDSLELIPPLISLGKSYLFVSPSEFDYQPDVSSSSGESFLRRANKIADENPDADWQAVERTLLSLGDFYILSGRPNRASDIYEEAWDLLSEGNDSERLSHRRANLESVTVLQDAYPPKYYDSMREENGQPPPDSFETGTISFGYTVSPTGRVTQLSHIETQPAGIKNFESVVGRSLRRMIYRPRIVDGQLVHTPDVVYVHEFFYRPTDLVDIEPDSASEPAGQ